MAINAGGTATTYDGVNYGTDKYFTGGTSNSTADAISGTTAQALYQTERYGTFSYEIPVTPGTYSMTLHFAEIYQTAAGSRSFNVMVEGQPEMSNVDLFSVAGHDGAYEYEVEGIRVTDGKLTISLESLTDNATIAGFAIYSADGELDTTIPEPEPGGGPNTMGFIGCSMAENTSQGYRAIGGQKMWAPYNTNGDVVQNWTNNSSAAWNKFDQQANRFGKPTEVWVQICVFSNRVTYDEVKQMIANTRSHAAPGVKIYISGQPLYASGLTCDLAGAGGPEKTDQMAKQAGEDMTQNVTYIGTFGPLTSADRSDSCHANTTGQRKLGEQAAQYFGK